MASLIANADGTFADPDDREAMVQAAEQAPSIEASDINDGDIINQTQSLDCGNGMMKYSITLPGGAPLECTPFLIERRRDMSKVWIATVRQQIVERAGAAAETSRAAALRARREKQMAGAGIQVAGQIPTPEEARMLAAAVIAKPADPAIADEIVRERRVAKQAVREVEQAAEPEDYAAAQLAKAEAELDHWTQLQFKAARNAKTAQKAVLKWRTVLESITDEEEAPPKPIIETNTRAARAAAALKRDVR